MRAEFRRVNWPFASAFRISYRSQTEAETVWAELTVGPLKGRGEGMAVFYHGETIDSILMQLNSIRERLEGGISRAQLQRLLPPGGARNAIDCALWDLESKQAGRRAWELAGVSTVKTLLTAYTLSLDSPLAMAAAATAARRFSLLKLKLDGGEDIERVATVRNARRDAVLIVDANQAWDEKRLRQWTPKLVEFGVSLIEQPLPPGEDEPLVRFRSPIPLCADESCQTVDSLPNLTGKYQYINIKLDKTGGLTEALRLAQAAREGGFKLMVGCMAGSSLSMAPAFVIGQLCTLVDLDGPLLAASDVPHAIRYVGGLMPAPEVALWG